MENSGRPTATEQAKMRAAASQPPRKGAPAERAEMDMAPPVPAQHPGGPGAPPGYDHPETLQGANPADLLHQSGPTPDQRQPRSSDEIDADMAALMKAQKEAAKAKEPPAKKEKSEAEEQSEEESWWNWQERDILANSKRRKQIEGNLKAMRIEDLLLHNEVKQTVSIVPGSLEVVFRSVSVDEDLAIKRIMSSFRGSEQYISDRYSVMNLVAGLFQLNDTILPDHLNDQRKFDEDLFNKKFDIVRKWPYTLVQDLVNNWAWFDDRVRRLFVIEELGNG
jgi:hypothetical protein